MVTYNAGSRNLAFHFHDISVRTNSTMYYFPNEKQCFTVSAQLFVLPNIIKYFWFIRSLNLKTIAKLESRLIIWWVGVGGHLFACQGQTRSNGNPGQFFTFRRTNEGVQFHGSSVPTTTGAGIRIGMFSTFLEKMHLRKGKFLHFMKCFFSKGCHRLIGNWNDVTHITQVG